MRPLDCLWDQRLTRCLCVQVEGIIRDDFTVEGYEILELLCELVAERAVRVQRPACPIFIYSVKEFTLYMSVWDILYTVLMECARRTW